MREAPRRKSCCCLNDDEDRHRVDRGNLACSFKASDSILAVGVYIMEDSTGLSRSSIFSSWKFVEACRGELAILIVSKCLARWFLERSCHECQAEIPGGFLILGHWYIYIH